jgi:hypothetical protein
MVRVQSTVPVRSTVPEAVLWNLHETCSLNGANCARLSDSQAPAQNERYPFFVLNAPCTLSLRRANKIIHHRNDYCPIRTEFALLALFVLTAIQEGCDLHFLRRKRADCNPIRPILVTRSKE